MGLGFNTFPGYNVMVTILALFLYGVVPLGTATLCYCITPKRLPHSPLKRLTLAPLMSLLVLITLRALFLFVFSGAQMHRVFQWLPQLIISVFVCGVTALYVLRERLRQHTLLKWVMTILVGYLAGIIASLMLSIALGAQLSGLGDYGNPSHISPHGSIAFTACCIALPFFLLYVFLVQYKINQPEKKMTRVISSVVAGVSITAGLITIWLL